VSLPKIEIGLAAALGGIAPNVLRIAFHLMNEQQQQQLKNVNFLGYAGGLILLAGLGFGVAVIWNERVPRRAFYLGMGLPAMLQVVMAPPPAAPTPANERPATASPASVSSHTLLELFSTSAYALVSEPPPVTQGIGSPQEERTIQHRDIMILFRNLPVDTQVIFTDSAGKALDTIRPDWMKYAHRGSIILPVPLGATRIEFLSSFTRNAPDENLRPDANPSYFESLLVESKADFLSGFLKALGRQSTDSMKLHRLAN
jgi:hypothetical protein